jgi:hypothetical protein
VPEASGEVKQSFEAYGRATASLDAGFLAAAYAETFTFAGPLGAQAVKRDDFLRLVPKRKAFFDSEA